MVDRDKNDYFFNSVFFLDFYRSFYCTENITAKLLLSLK